MNFKHTSALLVAAAIMLSASMVASDSAPKAQNQAAQSSNPPAFTTEKDKASYAIGASVGRSLHQSDIDVDPAILLRGLQDALAGGKMKMTDDEMRGTLTTLQREARERQMAKMKVLGEENEKEGAAFLAANKTKEGVVSLPSGLQYKIIKHGDGPKPKVSDMVVVNYRGTLVNGKEFDSTAKHGGQPATLPVGGVIKGWTEILQLMPVGSKYQVFIPADLAYGPRGPADIGPNATLIFDIELLSIKEKPSASATPRTPGAPAHPVK